MRFMSGLTALLVFAGLAQADELPDSVVRVLDGLGVSAEDVSVLVQPIDSVTPLLAHRAGEARNPASVMKLVTTWSALELLGPAFTWPTELYFLDAFDGTVLDGDLAIKGFGDPFFVAEELWKLVRALRRSGLTEIRGDLVVDDSFFDVGLLDPGAFDAQPYRTYNVTPSAILANFKAVRFQFFADEAEGRVRVEADPDLPNLSIRNRLQLVDGRCRAFQAGVSFNIADPGSASEVVLEGDFAKGCNGYGLTRTVLDHESYLYGLFATLWGEVGGRIRGGVRSGLVPSDADRVLTWQSRPLGEVIRSINKNSNNVMTRQLLLTLGAAQPEPPGSVEKGIAAIEALLDDRAISDGTLVMENGAGLSRQARISAQMLVDLLTTAHRSPYSAEFVASLSLAGEDGTTRGRFRSGDAVFHVKTGRLDHVSAVAGYAHGPNGQDFALAVLVNTPEAHRGIGEEIEQAVLDWIPSQF